jgi:hypothetical protein
VREVPELVPKARNRAFVGNFVERIGRFASLSTKFSTRFLRCPVLGRALSRVASGNWEHLEPGELVEPEGTAPHSDGKLWGLNCNRLCRDVVIGGLFKPR